MKYARAMRGLVYPIWKRGASQQIFLSAPRDTGGAIAENGKHVHLCFR